MKRIVLAVLAVILLLVPGCRKSQELSGQDVNPAPMITPIPIETPIPEENKTIINISQTLKMTNDWTIIGDYDISLTGNSSEDRVVLGTSAEEKNGHIMWDDTQYWTIAVLNEDGAYNLFSERMSGQVYIEVGEAYMSGLPTPLITAYIFSGTEREIRNYTFVDDHFEETVVYTTKKFSTGGVNCRYSTLPESEPK